MADIVQIIGELLSKPEIQSAIIGVVVFVIGSVVEDKYNPLRKLLTKVLGVGRSVEKIMGDANDTINQFNIAYEDKEFSGDEIEVLRKCLVRMSDDVEELLSKIGSD